MVFGLIMIFVLWLLWVLFVMGALWKIVLFFAGWGGIYVFMRIYVEGADKIAVTITDYNFSWAAVVPTIVCVFALLTSRTDQ